MMNQLHHPHRCINRLIQSTLNPCPQSFNMSSALKPIKLDLRSAFTMPARWVNISKSHPHYYFAMKHRFDIISEKMKYDSHYLKSQMDNDDSSHVLAGRFINVSKESSHIDLEDKNLKPLVSDIVRNIAELSPLMLAEVLHAITHWKCITRDIVDGNFDLLWNALDDRFASRLNRGDLTNKFSLLETFKVSNMFVISNPGVMSSFNYRLRQFLLDSGDDVIVNKDILINTLFLVRISQLRITNEERLFLEEKVNLFIDTMSIDEVGIICSTFNSYKVTRKFDTVLKDRLFSKVMALTDDDGLLKDSNRLVALDTSSSVEENGQRPQYHISESYRRLNSVGTRIDKTYHQDRVTVNTILKLFKTLTQTGADQEKITAVTDWLVVNSDKLKSLGVVNLKHLIHLKNNLSVYIPDIFDAAIDSIIEADTKILRSRDIETIISYAAKYGHDIDPNKIGKILDQYRLSVNAFDDPPTMLLHLATGLGYYNVYDDTLIRSSLDAQRLATSNSMIIVPNKRNEVRYLLLQLHTMVALECNEPKNIVNCSAASDTIESDDGKGIGTYDPILLTLREIQEYRCPFVDNPLTEELKLAMNKLYQILTMIHGTGIMSDGGRSAQSITLKQLLPYTFNDCYVVHHSKSLDDISSINHTLNSFNIAPMALDNKASVYLILHPFHYTSTGTLTGVIKLRMRLLKKLGFKNVIAVDLADLKVKTVPQLVIDFRKRERN